MVLDLQRVDRGAEQMLADRAKRQQRRQELGAVRGSGNFVVRLVQEGLLRAGYAFTDHTRNALILAIFGFKVRPYALAGLTGLVLVAQQ